jgi:hypothetical protein
MTYEPETNLQLRWLNAASGNGTLGHFAPTVLVKEVEDFDEPAEIRRDHTSDRRTLLISPIYGTGIPLF